MIAVVDDCCECDDTTLNDCYDLNIPLHDRDDSPSMARVEATADKQASLPAST